TQEFGVGRAAKFARAVGLAGSHTRLGELSDNPLCRSKRHPFREKRFLRIRLPWRENERCPGCLPNSWSIAAMRLFSIGCFCSFDSGMVGVLAFLRDCARA